MVTVTKDDVCSCMCARKALDKDTAKRQKHRSAFPLMPASNPNHSWGRRETWGRRTGNGVKPSLGSASKAALRITRSALWVNV